MGPQRRDRRLRRQCRLHPDRHRDRQHATNQRRGDGDPGQQVIVSFKVTIDAAPAIAAGTTYTWHGENVGAVKSNEVRKVTSNEVTLRAHYEELAKTGAAHLEVGGFGLISLLLGAGLMIATKRRRRDTA